ncbi:chitin synthase III catalytic subunit [Fimicolochytrium jonesii]|uniref:chitin synthase III catalytic subunit n=1 Tax=Fimicolochytrium jonesii TaxID=1396493 RepID=UPI0022FDFAF9|nr:chitin synthase III catalytic subunit [Fimicolochytrium jonesii]KAI8822370.1 chitin synthase III catalytic subunit [Fimicolochytrium jonesii]
MASFEFGKFDYFCNQIALSLCPLVGSETGIEPICYSRNIEMGKLLIFEPATLVIHIIALFMTGIMIYHIKTKYTAVGRKEIVMFFYMYFLTIILEFLVVSGIIQTAHASYPYFAAAHIAMIITTLWCLLLNGFVGFQWAEDGTPLSLWSIRISSLVIWGLSFFINIATFTKMPGFSKTDPTALFVFYFVFSVAFILIYVVLQIVLVVNTLDDRWPLGDILVGFAFFVVGRIFEFVLSTKICDMAKHYVDGMFFGTICSLLAVMMVYKYWDSITKEDLEFSVGGKSNVWEIRDPLLSDDRLAAMGRDEAGHGHQQGRMYDVRY